MRSTAFTFFASDGEDVRLVTIREDGGTFRMLSNPGQTDMGDPWDGYTFLGIAAVRRVQQALVQADGRRTASAVGAFVLPESAFRSTTGKRAGRWLGFAEAIERVLAYSADEYRGESHEDRMRDAIAILTQRDWTE